MITAEKAQNSTMLHTPTPPYTVRQLPVAEWERLRACPFGSQGLPPPDLAVIFVVEDAAGRIVGVWAALTQVMLDGLWKDPECSDPLVASRLLRAMKAFLSSKGILTSFTLISDPTVMVLAHKAGFVRAPGDLWILQLPAVEESSCL